MEQAKVVRGRGSEWVVVVVSESEMRVLRHAIRTSNALQLPGKIEPASESASISSVDSSEDSSEDSSAEVQAPGPTFVFLVEEAEPSTVLMESSLDRTTTQHELLRLMSRLRWSRQRRERSRVEILSGPLFDMRPAIRDVGQPTAVERAATLLHENAVLEDSIKIAA
ncbi:MAG: hypothetical protein NDI61_12800 [Bdellovibrionaceae bacterium]|nr:hypothetical protein [Pseudobdellovibrionaceae bacterium]